MDKYAFLKGYMDKKAGERLSEILAVLKDPKVAGMLAGGVGGAGIGAALGGKGHRGVGAGIGGILGAGAGGMAGSAVNDITDAEKNLQDIDIEALRKMLSAK